MNDTEKKKLQGVLKKIDSLRLEVEELIGAEDSTPKKKIEASQEVNQLIDSIDALSGADLESRLSTMGHKELGEIFVAVGGSSSDKRKPKAWLMERILWLAKEFSVGHKSIRES